LPDCPRLAKLSLPAGAHVIDDFISGASQSETIWPQSESGLPHGRYVLSDRLMNFGGFWPISVLHGRAISPRNDRRSEGLIRSVGEEPASTVGRGDRNSREGETRGSGTEARGPGKGGGSLEALNREADVAL
jgi:hypothetical protein